MERERIKTEDIETKAKDNLTRQKLLDVRKAKGLQTEWKNGEEVFEWWISN